MAVDLAALAASLRDNEALQAAFDRRRSDALETLARIDASDTASFHRAQATVALIDEIRADLLRFIRAGQPKPPPGIA